MNAALANVITSLRLIELEKNPTRIAQLLSLASRATEEQQTLINKVLNVFAAELEGLRGRDGTAIAEAKLGDAIRAAEENVAAQFADKGVRLRLAGSGLDEIRVAMDSAASHPRLVDPSREWPAKRAGWRRSSAQFR